MNPDRDKLTSMSENLSEKFELLDRVKVLEAQMGRLKTELQSLWYVVNAAEQLGEFCEHSNRCILSFREAGEPTENGGYREKYAGEWYETRPLDLTPKCNCGFAELWNAFNKAQIALSEGFPKRDYRCVCGKSSPHGAEDCEMKP